MREKTYVIEPSDQVSIGNKGTEMGEDLSAKDLNPVTSLKEQTSCEEVDASSLADE